MRILLNNVMRGFARFLGASWDAAWMIATTMDEVESTEFMSDWTQANWELLVESPFRQSVGFKNAYLEPYGEGADCNDASSRVWNPQALPTHRIVCQASESTPMLDLLTNRLIDPTQGPVVFDHFAVQSQRGWHEQAPPFDCILGYQHDQEVLIRLNQVSFVAEQTIGAELPVI